MDFQKQKGQSPKERALYLILKFIFTLVPLYASIAVHSDLLVGFERAKITGCLLNVDISRIICSVKAPRIVDTPIIAVGLIDFKNKY